MRSAIIFLILAFVVQLCYGSSFIKVRCSGTPLYRGRVDSIVSPGIVSGHVHKIVGGSNFSPALASQSPEQVYDDMMASPCTTCNVADVDLSAYWHPDLYYEWPNKSLSLVPNGGLTIYYLTRRGDDPNQKWEPFPRGFRMVSGNPFRRTFDGNSNADKAISFACLDGGPETNDFPTATRFCRSGLRLQVHFPQCWDGRLDTPNHKDHLAFPLGTRPDGGNCPSSHPRRLPNLFFEAFYSVDKFPHGAAPNGDGTQRFVLANGDRSGYGFHGDFLNGWDVDVLRRVLEDPSCDSTRTNNGDNVRACAPLTNHVQETPAGACTLNRKMFLTENLGLFHPMSKLPGCNPITGKNENAQICSAAPSATEKAPIDVRFHLRTEAGEYLTCSEDDKIPLKAAAINANKLTFNEIFIAKPYPGGFSSITHEGGVNRNLGANGGSLGNVIMCDKGNPSDWEAFQFVNQANGKVAIISKRTGKYLTVNGDKTIGFNTATTVGSAQLFTRIAPAGGSVY